MGLIRYCRSSRCPAGSQLVPSQLEFPEPRNAGLLAVRILALNNPMLNQKLQHFQQQQTDAVLQDSELQLQDLPDGFV